MCARGPKPSNGQLASVLRWWRLVLAAVVAVLGVLLGATTMSASGLPSAGIRVVGFTVTTPMVVGFDEAVWASQRLGYGAPQAGIMVATGVATDSGVSLSLKYEDGWTAAQRAAADEEVAALDAIAGRGDPVVTPVVRSAGSAAGKLRRAGIDVPPGLHGDHLHDLQLGGADTLENLWPLDGSVNSSLGAQIAWQIRDLPVGTCVVAVRIC